MITISPVTAADRPAWDPLWQAYLTFYESELAPEVTDDVFGRLVADEDLHGALARDESGSAVGLVHWLTHPSTWSTTRYCYLEDLYVDPAGRQHGTGASLISWVRGWATDHDCEKLYWLTQQGNATARRLYDRVATSTGFVHYEIEL